MAENETQTVDTDVKKPNFVKVWTTKHPRATRVAVITIGTVAVLGFANEVRNGLRGDANDADDAQTFEPTETTVNAEA